MAYPQNNERPVVPAATVTPDTPMPWTVVVQCLQKTAVKLSKEGKRYQNYVLCDMEGTLVGAVSYDHHVTGVNRLLQPYQRYYISNAYVKLSRQGYGIAAYPHGWTLSTRSPIELIPDEIPYTVPCDFQLTRFSELHRLIDHNVPIAVRGLIVHSYVVGDSSQASPARDYIIVNEEKKPIIVRVWGDMLDNDYNHVSARFPAPTMVVMLNVKVTTYHGLSLGTKSNTCAFHNPPLRDADALIEWYKNNSIAVMDMILDEKYKDTDVLLPPPRLDELVPIAQVGEIIDERKAVWVCGKVELMPDQQRLWYKACQGCNKTIKENVTWEFSCNSCHVKAPGQPRCHVGVYLFGGTSSLPATLFSPDAEKLIMYTAADLKAADEKNAPLTREISLSISQKEVVCFIKYLDKTFEGNSTRTYPVLKMYLKSDLLRSDTTNSPSGDCSNTGSAPVIATTEESATKEFLTPTLKNVVDAMDPPPTESTNALQSVTVKRPLSFEKPAADSCSENSANVELGTTSTVQVMPPEMTRGEGLTENPPNTKELTTLTGEASSKLQSPVKRIKNKED